MYRPYASTPQHLGDEVVYGVRQGDGLDLVRFAPEAEPALPCTSTKRSARSLAPGSSTLLAIMDFTAPWSIEAK